MMDGNTLLCYWTANIYPNYISIFTIFLYIFELGKKPQKKVFCVLKNLSPPYLTDAVLQGPQGRK